MKKILLCLGILILSLNASAQLTYPRCNYLAVDNILMDIDTANLMKVTISNSCTNCASGLGGCVYMELKVIRTIAPFDTIGDSKCYCKWTPDNNNQKTYLINSTLTSLPPVANLRVSLSANGCGCDTIAFKSTVGIPIIPNPTGYSVYPSPAKNNITIKNSENRNTKLEIKDAAGRLILSKETRLASQTIDVSGYSAGFYFVTLTDVENQVNKIFKIAKE